ncbi:hypothetical protein KR084_001678 [Drosophila pseudotakahashii]|nr:hypothetical protein KR084_001678 [Drosophila pseudotakahashii]
MASNQNPLAVSAPNTEVTQEISNSICEGISKLILWRDWRKSMLIFVALQSIIYDLSSEPTISVVNLWALTVLLITIFYRYYVRFLQWINKTDIPGNPYQKYLDMDISISPEQSKQLGVLFSNKIVWFLDNLRTILLVENPWKSFKVFFFLGGTALAVRIINFTILFQVVFVLLFTIPKIYEMKSLLKKFPKFRKCKDQVKSTELTITSESQVELDMNISKQSFKDFCEIVLKPENMESSFDLDKTQESFDDLKLLKTEEEAYDEFERLADWEDEDTLTDPTNQ